MLAGCRSTPDKSVSDAPATDSPSSDGGDSPDPGSDDPSDSPSDSPTDSPSGDGPLQLVGAALPGDTVATRLVIDAGVIVEVGGDTRSDLDTVDLSGHWLAPAFIDSHVHLAYLPEHEALVAGGVIGAVDLAAPIEAIGSDRGALRVLWSGPMITAIDGYPTRSWGQDGYGIQVATESAIDSAVDGLSSAGAQVLKLPITSAPVLSEAELTHAVTQGKARSMKTTSHALSDEQAMLAATVGIEVLAHMPTAALSAETIAAWSDRAVVPTVDAFGGGSNAVANLSALHQAGTAILYGTDFGNSRTAAIQGDEIDLMMRAGMSGAEILASGTRVPAEFWGFDELGSLEVGKAACLLVLDADPHADPMVLARPEQVWVDGQRAD